MLPLLALRGATPVRRVCLDAVCVAAGYHGRGAADRGAVRSPCHARRLHHLLVQQRRHRFSEQLRGHGALHVASTQPNNKSKQ
eukprot:4842341-Pyramimonas_sp.AAC.2